MLKVRFGVINDPEGSFQLRTLYGAASRAVPSLGELTSLLHLTSQADLSHVFPHSPGAENRAGQWQAARSSGDVLTGPQGVGMSCRCRGVRLGRLGPAAAAAPLWERERGRQGPYHPHRGGEPPATPHPQHGRLRGTAGRRPRAARGAARPARTCRPWRRPRALHGCGGVPAALPGPARPASLPRHGREALPGSSRAAGPPRSRPSAPGVPSALGSPPGSMEGRPAARRSARLCPAVRAP